MKADESPSLEVATTSEDRRKCDDLVCAIFVEYAD
jgi:hypothetical protein